MLAIVTSVIAKTQQRIMIFEVFHLFSLFEWLFLYLLLDFLFDLSEGVSLAVVNRRGSFLCITCLIHIRVFK